MVAEQILCKVIQTSNYSIIEDYLGFDETSKNSIFYLNGSVDKYLNL